MAERDSQQIETPRHPLAAKTGTVQLPDTQEFRKIDGTKDTWIAVYNPDYVVTVWLGFDETTSQTICPPTL